jgi:hypothetical protein
MIYLVGYITTINGVAGDIFEPEFPQDEMLKGDTPYSYIFH